MKLKYALWLTLGYVLVYFICVFISNGSDRYGLTFLIGISPLVFGACLLWVYFLNSLQFKFRALRNMLSDILLTAIVSYILVVVFVVLIFQHMDWRWVVFDGLLVIYILALSLVFGISFAIVRYMIRKGTPRGVIEKWVKAFNAADAATLENLYANHAVNHQMPNSAIVGKAAIGKMFRDEFSMAPEMHCTPVQIIEEGSWAVLEWTDPKGMHGCGFFEVKNGLIHTQRGYWDKITFSKLYNIPLEG